MHFVSELIHLLLLHRGVSLTFAKDWAFSGSWFWDKKKKLSKGPKFSCEANVYALKPCWHLLSIHACVYSFAQVSRAAMAPALCDGLIYCDKVGKEHRFQLMSQGSQEQASRAVLRAPALRSFRWSRPLSPQHSGYVSKPSDGVCMCRGYLLNRSASTLDCGLCSHLFLVTQCSPLPF